MENAVVMARLKNVLYLSFFFFFLLKLAQGRLMGAETEKKAPPRDSVSIDEQEISSSDTNVQIMSIEKFIGREDAVVFV